MATISDIGGGNNDYPDLISWGNARGSSPDLEIAHVYSNQLLTSDFDHRTDFTGGYEVVGMGNDFVGDFTDAGVIRITRDPAYTSWLIDDRTGRGHWRNLIIDCTDFNIVFRGGIQRFEATRVGFRGNNAPSFDEVATTFNGVFNQCAFFTENTMAASLRNGQVSFTDCIAVGNENDVFGTVRIRDMTGTVTNTVAHERQGSLCFGADGSTVTGSGCVSTDNSATTLSIGSQDSSLPTYFEDVNTGDLRINSAGQAALPASLSWAFVSAGGGVTADVACTVSAPTFASTASVTLPTPNADVAFSVNAPAFTASADATLPQPVVDAAFTISAPTFAVSADVTQPNPTVGASFSVSAPTFTSSASVTLPNPSADASFAIDAPTFSANAAASLPQPVSDVSFTIGAPIFSATADATQPGYSASVNFAVSSPTFSADAAVTLPQPVADGNLTIAAPTFSVVAIVGGIAIIVDDETNINQRVLSNNINAPILSNNING